jgi:hypothetical protein
VILLNARTEGPITFSLREHALRAVRAHIHFSLGRERPRYQALIQQLSEFSTETSVVRATIIVASTPTFQQTGFSATSSGMVYTIADQGQVSIWKLIVAFAFAFGVLLPFFKLAVILPNPAVV